MPPVTDEEGVPLQHQRFEPAIVEFRRQTERHFGKFEGRLEIPGTRQHPRITVVHDGRSSAVLPCLRQMFTPAAARNGQPLYRHIVLAQQFGDHADDHFGNRIGRSRGVRQIGDAATSQIDRDLAGFGLGCRVDGLVRLRQFIPNGRRYSRHISNGAVAPMQRRVQVEPQARPAALSTRCRRERSPNAAGGLPPPPPGPGQELAFGALKREGEGEIVPPLPAVLRE